MILEEIVLHNFGAYKDRHSLTLTPPSAKKPVVLIGGLNGGGKTTLLDAIHLSLYGKRARCSNRGSLSYEEFLRRSIHRNVPPGEGAGLEIQFRQRTEGMEHTWRVHRSWVVSNGTVSERIEIIKNNVFDRVLTESWLELVEEFLPVEISSLFFFDGEKIEGFADLENSTQLLSKAIHSLLGLDLVDRLATDLLALDRRKQTVMKPETEQRQLAEIETEINRLEEQQADLALQRAAANNHLDRRQNDLRKLEDRFRREGGELFERREQLEAERNKISLQLKVAENELRELAEGPAPLFLAQELLQSVKGQDEIEESATKSEVMGLILSERDEWILDRLRATEVSGTLLTAIAGLLQADRSSRASRSIANRYLHLTDEGRNKLQILMAIALPEMQSSMRKSLQRAEELRVALDEAERRLASIPAESAIAELIKERTQAQLALDEAQLQVKIFENQIEQLNRQVVQKRAVHISLLEKIVDVEFEHEDHSRLIFHSQKVRKTLDVFRHAVIERHVARISQLVFDSYRQLLRKQSLVSDLKIDPQSFALELRGPKGKVLSPDRLSAGERQLLAISMLWGLARASGRPLPAIIDTPLGRLDASHRSNLIERYFPYASHQVLLLSTDEEIDEKYYEKLKPWVGRSYTLEFDEVEGATQIKSGYFWE